MVNIKQRLILWAVALSMVAVCEAAELYYIEQSGTDTNWDTTGNWFTRDTDGDYHSNGAVPGAEDNVVLSGGLLAPNGLIVNTSSAVASGGQFRMGVWADVDLTINAGAELKVDGLSTKNQSTIVNYGTFESTHVAYLNDTFNLTNHLGASFTSQGFNVDGTATITNYGSMNIAAGRLYLATESGDNTWNVEGGTITAKHVAMPDNGKAKLYLNDGAIETETMQFNSSTHSGLYEIIVKDGTLRVNGDKTGAINTMINQSVITAAAGYTLSFEYDGTSYTTLSANAVPVPEPAHVTLVLGLFAALYLSLRARRVAI
jgi:hypothetical protein